MFTSIYNHAWISQWPQEINLREKARTITLAVWHKALREFAPHQIDRGINHCLYLRNKEFPPSLPEFRKLCRPTPTELGIPDEDEAFHCANHREWKHPAIWHAVNVIGKYEFRRMDAEKAHKRFISAYRKIVERCLEGEKFVLPAGLLTSSNQPSAQEFYPRPHTCSIQGCPRPGTICPHPYGDNWMCREHYREYR